MVSLLVQLIQASGYLSVQFTTKGGANKEVAIVPLTVSRAKHRLSVTATMFCVVEEGKDPRVSGF